LHNSLVTVKTLNETIFARGDFILKTKMFHKKKHNKAGLTLLILTAIGGACALAATQLQKKRKHLCKEQAKTTRITFKTAQRPIAAGCQKMGQNEIVPGKTDIGSNSSEWERGIS
jgi:hypothetical protein